MYNTLIRSEHYGKGGIPRMSKTAQTVLKIVAAGLAFAALVCLIVGGWQDMARGCGCLKERLRKRSSSEYDDYNDEALYQ